MRYLLVLVFVLVGCSDSKKPRKKEWITTDMKYCKHECLDDFLYRLDEVDGDALKELKASCNDLLKGERCCKHYRYDSWRACKGRYR